MEDSFVAGFEKRAFILKGIKAFGTKLLSKGGKTVVTKAKTVGSNFKANPLGTAGKMAGGALMGGLVLSEAMGVKDKAVASANRTGGQSMKSDSFSSYKR